MNSQHQQIFASGAVVLLAVSPDLQQIAQQTLLDDLLERQNVGGQTHLVGHDDFSTAPRRQREEFVRLGQGLRDRFFQVNVLADAINALLSLLSKRKIVTRSSLKSPDMAVPFPVSKCVVTANPETKPGAMVQCENIQTSSVALLMFAIQGMIPVNSLQSIIPAIAVWSPSQPAGIPSLLNFASGKHAVTPSFCTIGKHSTVMASRLHF